MSSPKVPKYLIYDGRYHFDPDRALVMDTADTLQEARETAPDYGDDCVIVETATGEIAE